MAEEGELEGPDLETLQAQIDMSMAFTHNIVSSWMKTSKAKLPSSSARNDDRDLEEYMRKPARYVSFPPRIPPHRPRRSRLLPPMSLSRSRTDSASARRSPRRPACSGARA